MKRAGILIVQLTRDPLTVTGNLIFRIVVSVLQNWPPIRYIIAVEQELISQNKIVKVNPFKSFDMYFAYSLQLLTKHTLNYY